MMEMKGGRGEGREAGLGRGGAKHRRLLKLLPLIKLPQTEKEKEEEENEGCGEGGRMEEGEGRERRERKLWEEGG